MSALVTMQAVPDGGILSRGFHLTGICCAGSRSIVCVFYGTERSYRYNMFQLAKRFEPDGCLQLPGNLWKLFAL